MTHTWKISFGETNDQILETGQKPYYFFQESPAVVAEPVEAYSASLDFKETSVLFDFLEYTQSDIADLLEVDPSTLSAGKRKIESLPKCSPKIYLKWIR